MNNENTHTHNFSYKLINRDMCVYTGLMCTVWIVWTTKQQPHQFDCKFGCSTNFMRLLLLCKVAYFTRNI